ncbi:hypothetical protein, partial [Escherichia coli]|uniref:hypothetical protein n=1 Tax=Escherichia coli TaxID=562 RepID=UPI001BFCA555
FQQKVRMIKKSKRICSVLVYPKILRKLSAKTPQAALRSFNYLSPKPWLSLGTSHYGFLSPKVRLLSLTLQTFYFSLLPELRLV